MKRIYRKIVMCISTGEIIEEDSYWYDGPVCECKSGGGSQTTVDPVYNARMAAIAEQQQAQATELFNIFKYGVTYDPNAPSDQKVKTGNKVINPEWEKWNQQKRTAYDASNDPYGTMQGQGIWSSGLAGNEPPKYIDEEINKTWGEVNGYDPKTTVSEMQLMQKQIETEYRLMPLQEKAETASLGLQTAQAESAGRLLPLQEKFQTEMISDASKSLKERSPVISKFYEEALSGVDVEKRVSEARAGVMQDFAGSTDIARRDLSRMGIDPTSGRAMDMFKNIGLDRATALAGASTAARNQAEVEKFERLRLGVGTNIQYA